MGADFDMTGVHPRLLSALTTQFGIRRRALDTGAAHVGWKLGMGEAERIDDEIAVGHLTSATLLETGSAFHSIDGLALHADAEIFLELGRELMPNRPVAEARSVIAAYGCALEIVDLGDGHDGPEAIIAGTVFRRAVAFGPSQPQLPADRLGVRVLVNGDVRATATAPEDLAARLSAAARCHAGTNEARRSRDHRIHRAGRGE